MSELKSVYIDRTGDWVRSGNDPGKFYLKSEVDAAIEEKDRAIEFAKALTFKDIEIIKEKDKEIAKLKAQLESEKASHYAEMVDAGMEIRRLKRALYKACANWAHAERSFALVLDFKYPENWDEMERKCRAKEEEYK